ncbi:MAG: hypothetical protein COC19_04400 [SAR86 cluster bacterium]|uniref:Uncharacterized protein n=1 Tax=SAR86 cluster bacterium TaxID=2030880 RepID=A0A2A4MNS5_9GAMM|nr:MAG: hypothetical protein COC19_04400 [SAR86 cluster bacterium]
MKKLLISLSLIMAMVLSQAASANDRRSSRNHYSSHSNHYSPFRGSNHYRGGFSSYNRSHFGISYNNHHGSSSSFFGGLILGSIFSPGYSSRRYDYREPVVTREIIYVDKPSQVSNPVGRRLLKDLEGNCFEVRQDDNGDEIRLQLEAEECSF